MTPAVIEVEAPASDDGATTEIAKLPGGGLESEVSDVTAMQVDPYIHDALALHGRQKYDLHQAVITIEIGDDPIELDQPLGGSDTGIDRETGGIT